MNFKNYPYNKYEFPANNPWPCFVRINILFQNNFIIIHLSEISWRDILTFFAISTFSALFLKIWFILYNFRIYLKSYSINAISNFKIYNIFTNIIKIYLFNIDCSSFYVYLNFVFLIFNFWSTSLIFIVIVIWTVNPNK